MAVQVWKAGTLSPRVQRLRDEYWSFYEREYYRNECLAYSTGDPWDELYAPYNWGVVPEVFLFAQITRHTVKAMAEKVEVPPDFYRLSIAERRALFFNLVLEKHLPAQVLEGSLLSAPISIRPSPRISIRRRRRAGPGIPTAGLSK